MSNYSSIKVYEVSGDTRPLNAISVWDASSSGTRPLNSIPVWKDTNDGDRPLNSIQVKIVDKAPNAIPVWFNGGSEPGPGPQPDPYNPLGLPPYTLRFQFFEPVSDSSDLACNYEDCTWTKVDDEGYIWDWTYEDQDWGGAFDENPPYFGAVNILGGNTTRVTNMSNMFYRNSIYSISNMDMSSITSIDNMFTDNGTLSSSPNFVFPNCETFAGMYAGAGLTTLPLLTMPNATDVSYMFAYNTEVISGALAMYQYLSQLPNMTNYEGCFDDCGSNTETGVDELAQIPQSWGGTGD